MIPLFLSLFHQPEFKGLCLTHTAEVKKSSTTASTLPLSNLPVNCSACLAHMDLHTLFTFFHSDLSGKVGINLQMIQLSGCQLVRDCPHRAPSEIWRWKMAANWSDRTTFADHSKVENMLALVRHIFIIRT